MPMLLPFGEAHQPYSPCKPPRPVAKFECVCDDASSAIAQLSGAARESEPALKDHAICSDPDRTGLRGLKPVQCIDGKANSWPLCFQLLLFLIDAENFDRSRVRTRFCVSVTVNMLLRITYNSSLTVVDFLTVQNGLHCLTIITRKRCQCDCSLVFARVTAERVTASLPPSPRYCRLAFCAVISSRISPMLQFDTNALERIVATCQCNNRSQAIEVTVDSFL